MLVLSRKLGERIMIGDDIIISVVDIDHGKIRLGITAPRDLPVFREEVYQQIHERDPNHASRQGTDPELPGH
jgi:carbon storage regulator